MAYKYVKAIPPGRLGKLVKIWLMNYSSNPKIAIFSDFSAIFHYFHE